MRPSLVTLPLLAVLTGLLTGCGGADDALDREEACGEIARAWPGDLYVDESNAAFARDVGRILERAQPSVRQDFEEVVTHLGLVVAAAGDNTAVLTESVEVRLALDEACPDGGFA